MATQFVEDDDPIVEIDDVSYIGFDVVSKPDDRFRKVSVSSQSTKTKRRAGRLIKQGEGRDGAKSKYVDPETLDGYALFDVVVPPYDLNTLAELYEQSSIQPMIRFKKGNWYFSPTYESLHKRNYNLGLVIGYEFPLKHDRK